VVKTGFCIFTSLFHANSNDWTKKAIPLPGQEQRASNETDAQSCLQAGASATVNHREDDWVAQVIAANGGKPVDRVVDVEFGANLPARLEMIKTSGTIVTYGSTIVTDPNCPGSA
jgi:D-arabinose 1-dehydrogenase-like Zn-dependent alcohol dehydrogenase